MVLEGDDRVNIIEGGTTVPTRVEVRDREDLPVSGASVQFQLEEDGPATLNGGLRQVTLTTDALGQAAVTVNLIASGAAQLSVTATFQGQTTTEVIVHTNFATVAEAEAAGVEAPADVGRETGGAVGGDIDVGGDTGGDAGGVVAADGGLGTGAMVGILGGVGAAVGVGVAVAGGGSSVGPPPPPPPPPPASVPSAPSRPTLTPGDRQLGVRWSAPASNGAAITDYDVRYRRSGGGWRDHPGQFLDRSTTITGLTNRTAYEVQVRAGNSVGKGSWSASATGTPAASASVPSAPSRPTLTPGDRQLGVRWSAPASNGAAITDYDVRYRRSGGGWRDHPGQFLDRSTTITGLTNRTAYEVQVRAGNSVGKGSWSASATGTPVASASVPAAPSRPTLTPGDRQLGVSWPGPASNGAAITDYDVRYRRSGGVWEGSSGEFLDRSTTITSLTNGTAYEVQVRAANSVGEGPWSASATGTPVGSVDQSVLIELYEATNGANWVNNTNWAAAHHLSNGTA